MSSSFTKLTVFLLCLFMAACSSKKTTGSFTIKGNIKNAPDQKMYLEQLFFSDKAPEVQDTADLTNGKFSLKGKADEESLFRIRLEKDNQHTYFFINDQDEMVMDADFKDNTFAGQTVNTVANKKLKEMVSGMMSRGIELDKANNVIDSLSRANNDSLATLERRKYEKMVLDFESFLRKHIDSSDDPVITIFAAGNDRNNDPAVIGKRITDFPKRFPNHKGIATVVETYKKILADFYKPKTETPGKPDVGMMAPDFTMNDVDGKPFSLSQLKGKYVLVDFWASWCGPCRGENPNVVAAFNKFKDKNFTVLGVSLDEDKGKWLEAIHKDNLTWKHISDLKGWECAAVSLYGFDGIPYNVLIDPSGKILATELRESALDEFLSKTLK